MSNKNCFDFLRFFFAANILLAHLSELSQNKSLEFLYNFSNSSIGVQGFFIISGFLVTKSYTNTLSIKKYFIKRIKRILPAYILVLLLSVLILAFFSTNNLYQYYTDSNTYKYFGWNSFFLNFIHPCLPGLFENNLNCSVNGSLWTLKVEEGFYVILPFIFFAIRKSQKPIIILSTIYVLSLLYWFLMMDYFNKPVLARQLPGYLSYFVVGIFLFLNFELLQQKKTMFFISAILLLSVSIFLDFPLNLFYPLALGVIIIIAAYNISFFNGFGKYGDFTYGLYIYHYPIIQLFRQYNLFENYNPILMGLLVILITLFFAVFSWFFIEKRFLDRFKVTTSKQILV